jgi:electron transport complex protein RnfE
MGLLFTFVLLGSNILVSLLRKIIPDEIRTPAYIVIIATFVTVVKMFTEAYLPDLYSTLGVFLSLLVVNCIVLGRAEAFASKNGVLDSTLDALGNGIGYTLAICLIALFREILGTGMLTFGKIFTFIPLTKLPILKALDGSYDYSLSIFSNPAGGFIVFGIILAVIAAITNHKKEVTKAKVRAEAFAKAEGGDK